MSDASHFQIMASECIQRRSRYQEKIQNLAQQHLKIETLEAWDFGYLKTTMCSYLNAKMDMTQFFEPHGQGLLPNLVLIFAL